MTRTRLSLAAFASVAVLVAAGCGSSKSSSSTGGTGVPTDSVATVAGTSITRAQLDDLMKTAELTYKQNKSQFPKPGTVEYQKLQQQAAVYLVTQEEYEQQAASLGIKVTPADVSKELDALIKQPWKGDRSKFDAYLKTTGYTLEQFNAGLERKVLGDRLTKAVTRGVTVTPAEVKAYYAKNKNASPYTTPAQRRVRHILVALNAKGVGVSEKGVTDRRSTSRSRRSWRTSCTPRSKAAGASSLSSRSTHRTVGRRTRVGSTRTSRGRSSRSSRRPRSRSRRKRSRSRSSRSSATT